RLGLRKIKLTGGEPLVRKGFTDLVRRIKEIPNIEEVTLTTNGILLEEYLEELKDAGLDSINISLDTLNPEKYREITRTGDLDKVLCAIKKACTMNF
ncbi:MAG: radical SAM protein, partial [Acetivibrio sp.]